MWGGWRWGRGGGNRGGGGGRGGVDREVGVRGEGWRCCTPHAHAALAQLIALQFSVIKVCLVGGGGVSFTRQSEVFSEYCSRGSVWKGVVCGRG